MRTNSGKVDVLLLGMLQRAAPAAGRRLQAGTSGQAHLYTFL